MPVNKLVNIEILNFEHIIVNNHRLSAFRDSSRIILLACLPEIFEN